MLETRHLEMHELLAYRDGEVTALARKHLASCEACRKELERLHRIRAELKALPGYTPPRDQWPRIVAAMRRRRRRLLWSAGTAGLAAAAALAGFILLRGGGPVVDGTVVPAEEVWVAEAASGDLGPFIRRSQELEGLLQTYSGQYRVYNAPTAIAVSALEDRIIILDRMLLESRQVGVERQILVDLWNERTATLETLVGIQLGDGRPTQQRARTPGGVWR